MSYTTMQALFDEYQAFRLLLQEITKTRVEDKIPNSLRTYLREEKQKYRKTYIKYFKT